MFPSWVSTVFFVDLVPLYGDPVKHDRLSLSLFPGYSPAVHKACPCVPFKARSLLQGPAPSPFCGTFGSLVDSKRLFPTSRLDFRRSSIIWHATCPFAGIPSTRSMAVPSCLPPLLRTCGRVKLLFTQFWRVSRAAPIIFVFFFPRLGFSLVSETSFSKGFFPGSFLYTRSAVRSLR